MKQFLFAAAMLSLITVSCKKVIDDASITKTDTGVHYFADTTEIDGNRILLLYRNGTENFSAVLLPNAD